MKMSEDLQKKVKDLEAVNQRLLDKLKRIESLIKKSQIDLCFEK